jgi:hypothetical protein
LLDKFLIILSQKRKKVFQDDSENIPGAYTVKLITAVIYGFS